MINENQGNERKEDREYSTDIGVIPENYYEEDDRDKTILKELKPDDVIINCKMGLRGYYYNKTIKEWVKETEPLMNEDGINRVIHILRGVAELGTLSNYKPEDVPKHALHVVETIFPILYVHWADYGMKQKSDAEIISQQIFNFIVSAFNKAIYSGDRNVVRGTLTESRETRYSPYPPQDYQLKRGGFNPFAR